MKVRSLIILAAWGTIAFAGQPAQTEEKENKELMNSQERMENRSGNASVLIGTGAGESQVSDTRPQGKKIHKDYSDLDVKKKK